MLCEGLFFGETSCVHLHVGLDASASPVGIVEQFTEALRSVIEATMVTPCESTTMPRKRDPWTH